MLDRAWGTNRNNNFVGKVEDDDGLSSDRLSIGVPGSNNFGSSSGRVLRQGAMEIAIAIAAVLEEREMKHSIEWRFEDVFEERRGA